ncbi:unnamed protein product [Rhizophagus irregularis]|uniref:Ricin B lectin domain-containing protein n=1 Tax=Rhizophagus irregularis TaxID=588596 RepID=A0A2I1FWF4_9GLOM|nr:hypothetical protein RhiirA4_414393 [Rhizophagus irregularis]CAB4403105.1 unnamed protein product [Rhizophagus irregularis]
MRFNFLLFLLTTLIAVALSQDWKPCQVNIKLKGTNDFWTLGIGKSVILQPKGPKSLKLTTVPFGVTPKNVKGSAIDRFHGESIKSNGLHKGITLSSTVRNPNQCWHFQNEFIQPCNNLSLALTASGPGPGPCIVKLECIGSSNRQKWVFSKVK